MMAVQQGRNRYEWFLCTTNQIKKMQLHVTFCGLKEHSCCTTLKQLSPNVKKTNYSQHLSWHVAMTPRFQLPSTWIASKGNATLHTFWLGHPFRSNVHGGNQFCSCYRFCNTVWLKRSVCACDVLLWKDNTSHFSANWCATATYVGMIVE